MCCSHKSNQPHPPRTKAPPRAPIVRLGGLNYIGVPLWVRMYSKRQPGGLPTQAQIGCGCLHAIKSRVERWVKVSPSRKPVADRIELVAHSLAVALSYALAAYLLFRHYAAERAAGIPDAGNRGAQRQ